MSQLCSSLLSTGICRVPGCNGDHDIHLCDICAVLCTSTNIYNSHLQGKKHLRRVAAHPEGDTPPGFKRCHLCQCDVPMNAWARHQNGPRHQKKHRFYAFKSVFLEAEKDKHGVTVSNTEGLDFGVVELADAQRGLNKNLILKTTVPSSRTQIVAVSLLSESSRRPQNTGFSISVSDPSPRRIVFGRETVILIKFTQSFRGRCEDRVEILLEDTQLNHQFIIVRLLKVIVGDVEDYSRFQPTAPYVPRRRTDRQPEQEIVPGERPESAVAIPWVVPLPKAPIPPHISSALSNGKTKEKINTIKKTCLPSSLNAATYGRHFKALLWTEEFQMDRDVERYDIASADLIEYNRFYYLAVPGLAEKRPSVLKGDRIFVRPHGTSSGKWFEGFVHVVKEKEVGLRFARSFKHTPHQKYTVHFKLNRYPVRRQHQAMDTVFQQDRVLFPISEHVLVSVAPRVTRGIDGGYFNPNIGTNPAQSQAVRAILGLPQGSPPFSVFGPPGTGKTVTIVESMKQLLRKDKTIKILACAPSNSAADLIAERLADVLNKDQLFRFYAPSRFENQVPDILKKYTYTKQEPLIKNDPSSAKHAHYSVPPMSRMLRFRVIVSTCVSASVFHGIGMPRGHFGYIFVDEAGQATEPEVMISVKTMADNNTRVVLSGDHKQLGPIIRSDVARGLGLETSYLERLMKLEIYHQVQRHGVTVVKLVKNFRSHEAILKFPNEEFYNGELVACADKHQRNLFLKSPILVNKDFPIIFHGLVGKDLRESSSPSFFNVEEILQVKSYVKDLKGKYRMTDHDIGVITPYHAQVQKIRTALRQFAEEVKVGSVEEFQGQERKVIIMSTVRSSTEFVEYDISHTLGFVASPRRFNVAVTRAKALLIIIGNPSVLSLDPLWRSFLNYIHTNRAWTGSGITWDPTTQVNRKGGYDHEFRSAGIEDMNDLTRRIQELALDAAAPEPDGSEDDEDGANVDRPWREVE